MTTTRLTASLLAALMLAACGGGGDGGGAPPPPPPPDTQTCPDGAEVPADQQCPTPPEPEPHASNLPFPLEPWSCDPSLAHIPGACGGDTGGRPHFGIWALPDADPADAKRSPVTHDSDGNDRRVFVGVDQGTERVGALPVVTRRGGVDVRFGALSDGAGAYLQGAEARGSTRVVILGEASQQDLNRVVAAVRAVNAALPEHAKLTVEPARPDLSLRHGMSGRTYFVTGDELPDTIHVEFVPGRDPSGGTAAARTFDLVSNAYVAFFRGSNSYRNEREAVILLAHEIIHARGLGGHVSAPTPSIMRDTGEIHAVSQGGLRQPMSVLYPADRESLRTLYGDEPSSASLHVHGNAPHAGFGVVHRGGYAEPWAYGYLNSSGLETNPELSGTITWSGDILGFTPGAEAVLGDAAIRVNIGTLSGTAAFTNLEHWAARRAPGAVGTGATWGDGDLLYAIAVSGNDAAAGKAGAAPTFRETGGDEGRLTGVFTGPLHEGAAGTLERSDLTAAFGASRE